MNTLKLGMKYLLLLDELKNKDQKDYFTNGCFDILHIGHVKYSREKPKALVIY